MNTKKMETLNKNREHEHCNHHSFLKEFIYGAPTGDLICAECQRPLSYIIRSQVR